MTNDQDADRICAYCSKPFTVRPWEAAARPAMFCSATCRNKARTKTPEQKKAPPIERTCQRCKKLFRTYPSEVKRGSGAYCSSACYHSDLTPLADRFWSKVNKTKTCWLWTGANSGGKWPYGFIAGNTPGEILKTHHVSWEMHYGKVPDDTWVLHTCDVTLCVRPDHLFLGTAADNSADMVRKGRAGGGRPAGSKLSPESLASFRRKRGWT